VRIIFSYVNATYQINASLLLLHQKKEENKMRRKNRDLDNGDILILSVAGIVMLGMIVGIIVLLKNINLTVSSESAPTPSQIGGALVCITAGLTALIPRDK
jgi:hypothetical protein